MEIKKRPERTKWQRFKCWLGFHEYKKVLKGGRIGREVEKIRIDHICIYCEHLRKEYPKDPYVIVDQLVEVGTDFVILNAHDKRV